VGLNRHHVPPFILHTLATCPPNFSSSYFFCVGGVVSRNQCSLPSFNCVFSFSGSPLFLFSMVRKFSPLPARQVLMVNNFLFKCGVWAVLVPDLSPRRGRRTNDAVGFRLMTQSRTGAPPLDVLLA